MVASSEQQSAPVIVNKPAIAHANSNQPGAPLNRDDSAEVMKMPEPTIDPITIMVASIGPRARTSPDGCRWLILSLTTNSAARLFSRLHVRVLFAIHARTQLRQVYHHERKLFRRAHRHRGLRRSALCLHAASVGRARQLLLDRGALHPVACAEPASRHLSNYDRQKLLARFAARALRRRGQARFCPAQTGLTSDRQIRWR